MSMVGAILAGLGGLGGKVAASSINDQLIKPFLADKKSERTIHKAVETAANRFETEYAKREPEIVRTIAVNTRFHDLPSVQQAVAELFENPYSFTPLKKIEDEFAAAKDAALKAEWTFHNLMLGAKNQVVAQFGPDSNQVESLGLKKKSEYRRPSRAKAVTSDK